MKKALYISIIFLSILTKCLYAQTGFGTNSPATSAVIEMVSVNKGFLPPRINLKGTNDNILPTPTIQNPVNGLAVFNISTINDINPGYYYFYNKWIRLTEHDYNWNIVGNSSTIPGFHFLGTATDEDVIFKRASIQAGLLNFSFRNISFGVDALNASTTGRNNLAIGYQSLRTNGLIGGGSSASNNTAIGSNSLYQNNSGTSNYAFGYQGLYNNIGGYINTAIGYQSMYRNINAGWNVAIGNFSVFSNTNGQFNTSIGIRSSYSNVISNNNVAVGHSSLSKTTTGSNTAIGFNALTNNGTIGGANIAIGANSLLVNQDGNSNGIVGTSAFSLLLSGSSNVAIGNNSGKNLINASNNIAIGAEADFVSTNSLNKLNIGNSIFGINIADTVQRSVGINTSNPNSTLHVQGSISSNIRSLSSGVVAETDYTILVEGNLSLPTPLTTNMGRTHYLINNTTVSQTITGDFSEQGTNMPTYILNNTAGFTGIYVQSTGAKWVILSKY